MAKKKEEEENGLSTVSFDKGLTETSVQHYLDSGALPGTITNVETALTLAMMGQEMGIKPLTAMNQIHVIKGRMVISSVLLATLLKQHGYEYQWTKQWSKEEVNGGDQIVTEITIFWKSPLGKHPVTGSDVWSESFPVTWAEMVVAGYTDKQNWEKYPKNMLRARCMAYAVRAICPHVLAGLYTDSEIVDSVDNNGEYTTVMDSEGETIIIKNEDHEGDTEFEELN